MNKKALVSFSGGMDSTVLAVYLRNQGYDVTLGIFKTSNKTYLDDDEVIAKQVLERVDTKFGKLNTFQYEIFNFMDFFQMEAINPKEDKVAERLENNKLTVYYSGFKWNMLSTLLSYGSAKGYDLVTFGHNKHDNWYRDEKLSVHKRIRDMFAQVYDRVKVPTVEFPFKDLYRWQIIKLNNDLNLVTNLEETYSCGYSNKTDGLYVHCGTCHFCQERKLGFSKANILDKTRYVK